MSEASAAPAAAPSAGGESTPSSTQASNINSETAKQSTQHRSGNSDPKAAADGAKNTDQEKITVKINGKLKTMSRDEAMRELQKGIAAREKFEKAATLTQKNQQLLRALQDPNIDSRLAALKQLGVDPDEIAEYRLKARAQQERMTPEQQRIAELESQIADSERAKTEAAERQQQEAAERQDREIWAKTEQEYITAIDQAVQAGQLTGIPPAEALYLMADAAEMNLAYGLDLPAAELISEAKAKVESARSELQQKIVGGLEGDALLDFLGPEAVKKIAAAAVRKFKAGTPIQPLAKPAQIADSEPKEEKRQWIRPNQIKTEFL